MKSEKEIKYITQKQYDTLVKKHKYKDLNEIHAMMDDSISAGFTVFIKFICKYCGAIQTSSEPNCIHIMGYTCEECGEVSTPSKFGMMLILGRMNEI